jgi:hypothetical protein
MQQLSLDVRRVSPALLGCVVFIIWAAGSVSAQGAQLWLDPSSLNLAPGDVKTVDIRVKDVTELAGAEVHLAYDPALLEVVDADAETDGVQIAHGDFLSPEFVVQNTADGTTGTVDYAIALMSLDNAASGDGVLARITFRGLSKGKTTIAVQGVLLADKDGQPIDVETESSQAVVGGSSFSIVWVLIGVAGVVVLVGVALILRNTALSRPQKGGSI